ncbi:hypothetical protein AHAS_Ahas01G0105000 [Arachis hypogaea]
MLLSPVMNTVVTSKRMMSLVKEEEFVRESQENTFLCRLAKLLMMSVNKRINVLKLNELKRNSGFLDDYMIRIVAKYPNLFCVVNEGRRKSFIEIELVHWNPELAVSIVETTARRNGNTRLTKLVEGTKEMEKRNVGLAHKMLSLTLWKKASIVKLSHFRRVFALSDRLNVLLLKHHGIFCFQQVSDLHSSS